MASDSKDGWQSVCLRDNYVRAGGVARCTPTDPGARVGGADGHSESTIGVPTGQLQCQWQLQFGL